MCVAVRWSLGRAAGSQAKHVMRLQARSHNKWLRFDRMCEDASNLKIVLINNSCMRVSHCWQLMVCRCMTVKSTLFNGNAPLASDTSGSMQQGTMWYFVHV